VPAKHGDQLFGLTASPSGERSPTVIAVPGAPLTGFGVADQVERSATFFCSLLVTHDQPGSVVASAPAPLGSRTAKGLASQNGKRLQLTLSSEKPGLGRLRGLAKVERYCSACQAGSAEDSSADGSRICELVVARSTLAALVVKRAADGETEPTPPAKVGAVLADLFPACRSVRSESHASPASSRPGEQQQDNGSPSEQIIPLYSVLAEMIVWRAAVS